uniref:Cytochrome b n=1 Tax=Polyascus gregaria TaxID=238043 RepID=H8ZWN0_9CRUS|nr:cytochrome b [Polyascus gregaria]
MTKYLLDLPTPSNINYMWNFGSLLGLNFMIQFFTGFFLSMYYVSNINLSFDSIYYIMMDVNNGWVIRMLHVNGASFFFIFCYFHIGRSMYYGNYMNMTVWFSGIVILLLLFSISFLGYVLPWGQMSFWGATVITKLITAVPYIGDVLVEWIWGGFILGNATLSRFFSLHFFLPFIMFVFVFFHLLLLHIDGSTNPVNSMKDLDKIPFHPYFLFKDILGFIIFFFMLFIFSTLFSDMFFDCENFNLANSMVTPHLIKPEWYFLFAYCILRSVPNKLGGVVALLMSILILVVLPLSDFSKFKYMSFYPYMSLLYMYFVFIFIFLIFFGSKVVEQPYITFSIYFSIMYFMYFLIVNIMKMFMDFYVLHFKFM